MLGYVTWYAATCRAAAVMLGSFTLIPRNVTPRERVARQTRSSPGCSALHGAHHEPQTLRTTGPCRRSASETRLPSRPVPARSGPGLRCAGVTYVATPSPDTNR